MTRIRGKKPQTSSGSDVPAEEEEEDDGPSSPLLDDFDEELCMELEEVGKELDLYKAESSQVTNSGRREHPPVCRPLQDVPHGTPEATQPTSLCATEPRKAEGGTVSADDVFAPAPVSGVSVEMREVSEEESECQLKALTSLKASLVGKLKLMVTHKTNLAQQKDFILKNFDGDKAKLSKNLQKHLSQCKEVDIQIQSLNAQITMTRKKIIALKTEKHLEINKKNMKDSCLINEKHLPQAPKDLSVTTDDLCGSSNGSLAEDTLGTVEKEEDRNKISAEGSDASQDGNQTDASHGTVHARLPAPAETQGTKKGECLVVEKVASTLAMHPSSKNMNTLWCKTCNLFLTSITGYIKHLELPEHLTKEHEGEHRLHKLLNCPKKVHGEDGGSAQEALGVEFVQSTKLIYCSLCECPLLTREEATNHSQSLQHTTKYKEYILKNTTKELAFQKAKMEAFTEYCKRRKAAVKDKKQKPEGKAEDLNRKAGPNVDENELKAEAGLRATELLKIKIPNEKKGGRPQSENNSSGLQGKQKEGMKLIKEGPLMPQKINVNVKTGTSVVGESITRTSEHPAVNKRQKIIN